MKAQIERLGKVSVTVDKYYWSISKAYDRLVIVERDSVGTFISRKPVPAGIDTTNREYWIKLGGTGSGGGAGISQNFGDDTEVGISQKTLTLKVNELEGADASLQNQINALIADNANVNLTANPNLIRVGEETTVTLTATSDTDATSIVIKELPSTVIKEGSGRSTSESVTLTPNALAIYGYEAIFTIEGTEKQVTFNVRAVYPIKYGAGRDYTDADNVASARTTPAGTYTITVENNEDYVFFVIPNNMAINGAKLNGFDFPLDSPVPIAGTNFIYYKSSNSYDAGTLTIEIE